MPLSMLHTIKILFHTLIVFQSLLFAVFLLTHANARRRTNVWLAAFLLAQVVISLGGILDHFLDLQAIVWKSMPWLFYIDGPFSFLPMPFLFLYILALTRDGFKFRAAHLWHGLPFLLDALFVLGTVLSTPAGALRELVQSGRYLSATANDILFATLNVQALGYLAASFLVVRNYRRRIKSLYSAVERINLSWLVFVLAGLGASRILILIDYFTWLAGRSGLAIAFYIAAEIFFLAFVSLAVLKGLRQPVIFLGPLEASAKTKYEKTLLPESVRTEYRDRLAKFMDEKKPFLNPLLGLTDLSSQVKIPAHHLSQVVNACFRQNFFDFINAYRVRECQRLMASADGRQRTVLDILYETGFNSKSVFNTAFKKHAGMTPSEFRRAAANGARPGPA